MSDPSSPAADATYLEALRRQLFEAMPTKGGAHPRRRDVEAAINRVIDAALAGAAAVGDDAPVSTGKPE